MGNFVETKKTRLGRGSKANHLTYLGDAEIGERVNVGAGTITCNYDGEKKHPTRIGDGVFVGSDSILVAPIEIGAGAYVAAGSTLTDASPAGRPGARPGAAGHQGRAGWHAASRKKRIKKASRSPSGPDGEGSPRRRGRPASRRGASCPQGAERTCAESSGTSDPGSA